MRHNYPDLAIRQKPIFLSRRQRGGSYPTPGPKAPRSRLGDDGDVGVVVMGAGTGAGAGAGAGVRATRGQAVELSGPHHPHPISSTRSALSSSACELSVCGPPHSISSVSLTTNNNILSSISSTQLITHASDLAGPQSISSRNPMITSTSDLSGPQSITIIHHPKPLVPSAGCTLAPIAAPPVPKAVSPVVTPIAPVPKPGLPAPVPVLPLPAAPAGLPGPGPVPAPVADDVREPQPLVASAGPASVITQYHHHERAAMAAVGQSAVSRSGQQRAAKAKEPDLLLEVTARLGRLSVDEPLKYPIEETQAQAQAQAQHAACSACHEHHRSSSSRPAGAVATTVAAGVAVVAPPTGQVRDGSSISHQQPILCAPSALPMCSISGCSSCAGPDVLRHHQHQLQHQSIQQHSLHVGASTIKEPPSSLYMPPSPMGMCPPVLEPLAGHGSAACPGPLGQQPGASPQQPEDELLQTYVLVEPDRK